MPTLTREVLQHRLAMFAELGFEPEQALTLAQTTRHDGFLVDVHAVRRAIASGCDVATAFQIYS